MDAWLKLNPDKMKEARQFLTSLVAHLNDACIDSVTEVFDAEQSYSCIAQAWSVSELLRCWVKTAHT